MDLRKIRALVHISRNTSFEKSVPSYELPLIRMAQEARARNDRQNAMPAPSVVGESKDVIQDARRDLEWKRLIKRYGHVLARKYPTEDDFAEAWNDAVEHYAVEGTGRDTSSKAERQELPIEQVNGINDSRADAIRDLLGDGELVTLAETDPNVLAAVKGISIRTARKYIAEAKELAGLNEPELEIIEGVNDTDTDTATDEE